MQALLWKFTVLAGVIGVSCAVVWEAHQALQNRTEETSPEEFFSLYGDEDGTDDDRAEGTRDAVASTAPLQDRLEPLPGLAQPEPEPTPTPAPPLEPQADVMAFASEVFPVRPSEPAPAGEEPRQRAMFFPASSLGSEPESNAGPRPAPRGFPGFGEESSLADPTASAGPADTAMIPMAPPQSEPPTSPFPEPEPLTPNSSASREKETDPFALSANTTPPPQRDDRDPLTLFGPSHRPSSEMSTTTDAAPVTTPPAPGLTRLPPKHPAGVPMPTESPTRNDGGVTTADVDGLGRQEIELVAGKDREPRNPFALTPVPEASRNSGRLQPAPEEVLPLQPVSEPTLSSPPRENPLASNAAPQQRQENPFAPRTGSGEAVLPPDSGTELEVRPLEPQGGPAVWDLTSPPAGTGSSAAAAPAAGETPRNPFLPLSDAASSTPGVQRSTIPEKDLPITPQLASPREILPADQPTAAEPSPLADFGALPPPGGQPTPVPAERSPFELSADAAPAPPATASLPPANPFSFDPEPSPAPAPQPSSGRIPDELLPQAGTAAPGRMSSTSTDLVGDADADPLIPTGPQTPELKIEKIAPKQAAIGEPLIYAINIRNVGGSAARDVVVEDRIPRGTRLEGTIPQAVLTRGKLVWDLGTIAPGEERKIQLKVIPTEAGEIGSVATVSFAAAVSASIRVTAPKLSISAQGPAEALLGDQIAFRFMLKNTGEASAKSVFIRTILPNGLSHPGGNDLEYEVGTLAAGESRVVDLNVTAIAEGAAAPRAIVTIDGKTQDEATVDMRVIKSRLEITRTGPAKRFVGRPAEYTNAVTNQSSEPLVNVTLIEQLPAGVELAGMPAGGSWDPVQRVITWRIGELRPGETKRVTSQLAAARTGTHAGKLSARDSGGNQTEVATSLDVKGFPDLGLDLSSNSRTVLVGDQVSFRLTLRNDGTAAASGVTTQFEIPRGLEFTNADGPVRYETDGKVVRFAALEELPVEAVRSFDIVLTAAEQCETKVRVTLESADFGEPVVKEERVRVIQESP